LNEKNLKLSDFIGEGVSQVFKAKYNDKTYAVKRIDKNNKSISKISIEKELEIMY
jgi:hypothetical protein